MRKEFLMEYLLKKAAQHQRKHMPVKCAHCGHKDTKAELAERRRVHDGTGRVQTAFH